MRTYSQLNEAEKRICDSVTATWWFPSGDPARHRRGRHFRPLSGSIRALGAYQAAEGVSTSAIIEAIVNRYNYLVSLSDE